MAWKKSSPELIARFAAALPADAAVERRQMFGYPCAFVNGQMFAGLHEERLVVRLAEVDRERGIATAGATRFEPMPGRIMREYIVLSPATIADAKALQAVVGQALTFAASLPPKRSQKKVRAKKIGVKSSPR